MELSELHILLDRLIEEGETEYIEFKRNNNDPKMIGQRLSALSNGAALHQKNYGYLVFGIEDNSLAPVGTTVSIKNDKKGNEILEHWLIRMLTPRLDIRVYEFQSRENTSIVIIQIPPASGQPVRFENEAHIRISSLTKKLRDYPEKERRLWQAPSSEFEQEYATRAVSATDVVALLDTQSVFDLLLKIPYPTTQEGVIEKLLDEKFIVRSNGHYNITNLGAILFAKNLNQFDGLARKAPRVIKYKGKTKLSTEKDQTGSLGYANGFQRMLSYIEGLLPSNELIEDAMRKEVSMYPSLALRELIANALIHQDFRIRGAGIMIEIYDNRIEISNPGQPIVDVIRFIDAFQSRNEMIASVMRRIGLCEEKGSGIDKVISECESNQLPPPDFRVNPTHTIALLYAHKEFKKMDKNDRIRACYQHCVLWYVHGEVMTNQSIRERFKLSKKSSSVASKIIKDTIDEELIKVDNTLSTSKKLARYIPFWA